MAALDFPSNPTIGQNYSAPNGSTYQWDGVVWTVTPLSGPPSGSAGGDLAGSTYPAPIVAPGAITFAKLATDAKPWTISGATLTPTDATKAVSVPATDTVSQVVYGSGTIKTTLRARTVGSSQWNVNRTDADGQYDASKASWSSVFDPDPTIGGHGIYRKPPAGAWATLLTLDANGYMHVNGNTTGAILYVGDNSNSRGVITAGLSAGNPYLDVAANVSQFMTARSVWNLRLDTNADNALFMRQAPSGGAWTNALIIDSAFNLTIAGPVAVKSTGTAWANPSDRRLKDNIEDYATGLAAILQLQPRTFLYNGKGGSTAGMRGYGFIADEIAPVMPETVGVRAGKLDTDDEDETDIETLDQSNLILALVNAVKELAVRVAALEKSV